MLPSDQASEETVLWGQKHCEYVNELVSVALVFCGYCEFETFLYLVLSGFAVASLYFSPYLRLSVGRERLVYGLNCNVAFVFISALKGISTASRGVSLAARGSIYFFRGTCRECC